MSYCTREVVPRERVRDLSLTASDCRVQHNVTMVTTTPTE